MQPNGQAVEEELARAEEQLAAAVSRVDAAREALASANFEFGVAESELDAARARVERLVKLKRSMADTRTPSPATEVLTSDRSRTDAIVEILEEHAGLMSITDVLTELHTRHDPSVAYPVVASTLNYLVKEGRITRPTRGRYAAC